MAERVFITGMGAISALGTNLLENHQQLISGNSGIGTLKLFNSKYAETCLFGEVKVNNDSLQSQLNIFDAGITRTTLLAVKAFDEALKMSGLSLNELASQQTTLIVGNTVGGMCLTDELFADANLQSSESPFTQSYDGGAVTLFLQKRCNIGGICNTINTACSSSANAIIYGSRLIKNGLAKRAIVGGVDSLSKFTINGFNALGILAPQHCRPFDEQRNGLNLGEGAGFLVLEAESVINNKTVFTEIAGFGNSNDAYHPSAISPNGEGPYLSMMEALNMAQIKPEAIGFINAHGTGTENNDETESAAMQRVFSKVPPFASSKSKIGHTLGAAGALEAVFAILGLHHQEIYPSYNFKQPIAATRLKPNLSYQKKSYDAVMSNSFGFGGNCSTLIFTNP